MTCYAKHHQTDFTIASVSGNGLNTTERWRHNVCTYIRRSSCIKGCKKRMETISKAKRGHTCKYESKAGLFTHFFIKLKHFLLKHGLHLQMKPTHCTRISVSRTTPYVHMFFHTHILIYRTFYKLYVFGPSREMKLNTELELHVQHVKNISMTFR